MSTEGKALVAEINAAEQVYYSRNGHFYATSSNNTENNTTVLGVDARTNKYFKSYKITTSDDGTFEVKTEYEGKAVALRGSLTAEPQIIDEFSRE